MEIQKSIYLAFVVGLFALIIFSSLGSASPTQQNFTSSGDYSWIVPQGVYSITANIVGAGGGAGGGCSPTSGTGDSGGAGGGGYSSKKISVIPGQTIDFHVGKGGLGTSGCSIGTNGEASYIKLSSFSINLSNPTDADVYAIGGYGSANRDSAEASDANKYPAGKGGQGYKGLLNNNFSI